ncbi:MAG: hypothetical protein SFX18_16425 [Pirellulales bacterium]|nr:hypothetical protein [Pirellulales bacterium]
MYKSSSTLRSSLCYLVFLLAVLGGNVPISAEKVDLSADDLRKIATHVVTGEVLAIYERAVTTQDWKYTHYVAEVRVNQVEKGEGVKNDELIYVRYWQRRWNSSGPQPPSTIGHRGLPQEKDKLRFYLAQNAYDGFTNDNQDGGYNVIGANGFEELPAPEKK